MMRHRTLIRNGLATVLALTLSFFGGNMSLQAASQQNNRAFDFYVLSLSWSPSWCATHPDSQKSQQCDPDRNYGFIVHGLWPQNEHGYPEFCPSRESDRVPSNLGRRYFDLIPSMGLIGHEWRKHGVCSGLSQADYFALLRQAYGKIRIPPSLANLQKGGSASPDMIEKAFLATNPGLAPTGIAVACSDRMLSEIRICLNKDLSFRDCHEVDQQACPLRSVKIPPIP
jgi:ribonuclease T2